MGAKSSIDKLSPELRTKLLELLQDQTATLSEVTAALNAEAGETVVSRSAVGRYAQRMERFAERNRQAQAVAQMYINKVGVDTTNKLGRVANEQIRLLVYDLVGEIEEMKEAGELDPKQVSDIVYKVSRGVRELELASKLSSDREREIRRLALEDAAEAAESLSRQAGLSAEAADQIRQQVLGGG